MAKGGGRPGAAAGARTTAAATPCARPRRPVKDAAGFQMVGGGHHKGGRGRKQGGRCSC